MPRVYYLRYATPEKAWIPQGRMGYDGTGRDGPVLGSLLSPNYQSLNG